MTLRNLFNAEMIAVSAAWLDDARHRPAFVATPLMAGLLPEVERSHDGLLSLPHATAASDQARELAELQAEEKRLDRTHDRKGAGVLLVLQGVEAIADDEADVARVAEVRAKLFPEGASVFAQSYLAEAGHAERVEKLLADPDVKSLLKGIIVRKGHSLLDDVVAWAGAGRELGVLESRKAALVATMPDAAPVSRAARAAARNAWLQTAAAVVGSAKLLKGAQAERFAPALQALQLAEAKADERSARRRAGQSEVDPVVTPAPPATPTVDPARKIA